MESIVPEQTEQNITYSKQIKYFEECNNIPCQVTENFRLKYYSHIIKSYYTEYFYLYTILYHYYDNYYYCYYY